MIPAIEKEDLRNKKTEKALSEAMYSLLGRHSFKKITVGDICKKALISRATFYTHFTDKYNFLEWWMITAWSDKIIINNDDPYELNEQKINLFAYENKTVIKNLFIDADNWTLDTLFGTLYSILHLTENKTIDGLYNPKYIVLSNFYIGGMIHYILWQVKNDFPRNVTLMNSHLYEVIKIFKGWN